MQHRTESTNQCTAETETQYWYVSYTAGRCNASIPTGAFAVFEIQGAVYTKFIYQISVSVSSYSRARGILRQSRTRSRSRKR